METERGSQWPEDWPARVQTPPYWLNKTQIGIYGKPAPNDFEQDYENWKSVVTETYMNALMDLKLWVMNVVNIDSPDTLPMIYDRGLLGIYHDWCESFSTYPRTYDLLHADHLFSNLKKRTNTQRPKVNLAAEDIRDSKLIMIIRDQIDIGYRILNLRSRSY
ncbi:hypothetical protein Ccrd_018827 [Cynara cardunculus var. scolymus]|uniref:Methyltransferase n=1 Tax=Cynara cardunculus var. scolymus TaxID=59895 RepID=A0A103Y5H7_CYNCS|nr:hypothetical protein Ccrd_018827 [Cynara cardunculus var. scolymus]